METEKIQKLIIKFINLTKTNELKWISKPAYNKDFYGFEILGKLYLTEFNGKKFRLYRWKDEQDFDCKQKIKLELIDDEEEVDYDFEFINEMKYLYKLLIEKSKLTKIS